MFGLERPQWLFVLLPLLLLLFWRFWRREEKSYLIQPCADHLRARCGSGKLPSHRAFLLLLAAAIPMLLVVAGAWWGTAEVREEQEERMVGNLVDLSGSMGVERLTAAVQITNHLIRERPKDRINLGFFASESAATPFGIPESYLNLTIAQRIAMDLGGDTNASVGLLRELFAFAYEEQIFSQDELDEILRRASLVVTPYGSEERQRGFVRYVEALMSRKKVADIDRVAHFISDCALGYEHYNINAVMALYRALKIRVEAICIEGNLGGSRTAFLAGIRATGGNATNVSLRTGQDLSNVLREVVERIEQMKPRSVRVLVDVEKKQIARECFLVSLALMALVVLLERRLA